MHTHLKRDDRIALGALRRAGLKPAAIATQLGVHRSTISRELKRNKNSEEATMHSLQIDRRKIDERSPRYSIER